MLLNEFGNPHPSHPMYKRLLDIGTMASDFMKDCLGGYSLIEARAIAYHLANEVSVAVSTELLLKRVQVSKKKREESLARLKEKGKM